MKFLQVPSVRRTTGREPRRGLGRESRRALVGAAVALLSGLALTVEAGGCGGEAASLTGDAAVVTDPPPSVGAHAIVFQRQSSPQGKGSLVTPGLAISAGSTILVSQGRGELGAFAPPTDSRGHSYQQLGTAHPYTRYPGSGTAVYAATNAQGGSGQVLSATTPPADEITMSVVEVKGTKITAFEWKEVQAGAPLTSPQITTTGPATLVAWWWGDAGVDMDKTAKANNGFAVIDAVLSAGALVQSAVAVKEVTAAGTYDVTWTSTPVQGAQLWIVAVEP